MSIWSFPDENSVGGGLEKRVANILTDTNPSEEILTTISISENDTVFINSFVVAALTNGSLAGACNIVCAAKRETAGSAEIISTESKNTISELNFDALLTWEASGNDIVLKSSGTGELKFKAVTNYMSLNGPLESAVDSAPDLEHTQNTDTGTTSPSFQIDSGNSGARIKNSSGVMQARNAGDTDFASFQGNDFLDNNDDSILPGSAVLWADEATVENGNALVSNTSNTQLYNAIAYQSPAANGDKISHSVYLRPGTYKLDVLGVRAASRGTVNITLSGPENINVGGQDWYNSALEVNHKKTVTGISIAGGRYSLNIEVTGKNASSSDYLFVYTKISILRTGD